MKNPNLRKFYSDFYEQTDRRYRYYPSCSEMKLWGSPRSLVAKNRPASAGDTRPIPDLARPHTLQTNAASAQQLLSILSGAALHSKRNHHGERPVHRSPEEPLLATAGESPGARTKTQHSQKETGTFLKKK